jgi:hypothetical protein
MNKNYKLIITGIIVLFILFILIKIKYNKIERFNNRGGHNDGPRGGHGGSHDDDVPIGGHGGGPRDGYRNRSIYEDGGDHGSGSITYINPQRMIEKQDRSPPHHTLPRDIDKDRGGMIDDRRRNYLLDKKHKHDHHKYANYYGDSGGDDSYNLDYYGWDSPYYYPYRYYYGWPQYFLTDEE